MAADDEIHGFHPLRRIVRWLRGHELGLTLLGLTFTLLFIYFWPKIVISIPSGFRGVLWSRFSGTHINRLYREGLHLILPWDVMTQYDVRFQSVDRTFTLLSQDGLPVDVEVTMRFKPSETRLGALHARVGPSYVDTIVIPETAAALRAVIGNYRPEALYGAGFENIQQEVTEYAVPQTGIRYVVLDDLLIRRIILPPAVIAAIEGKFQQEQAAAEMQYRITRETQEANRKQIEARGIEAYNNTVAPTLTQELLQYKGIEATLELAKSTNSKVIVIGASNSGLPLILNPDGSVSQAAPPPRR
jgi:regulator of protease activity HflC (stomatin/prohibitin superfamily)